MSVRLLVTAGALALGLSSAALAQGMQPMQGQAGMQQGGMSDDMGRDERPMARSRTKKMKKSMKGQKAMRSRQRMNQGSGMEQDGGGAAGGGM